MLMRTEFRPNPSKPNSWQEVEVYTRSANYFGPDEVVVREYREALLNEDLEAVRASGKSVILASANPDLWIVEV
jgi:hypothetical protein